MVDQAALLGEHAFDDTAGQIAEDYAVTAHPQAMIASQPLAKRQAIPAFLLESAQREP
jgi:hypothetical protein